MNYRHAFHAGNHADVLKHLVWLQLLKALQQKEKPLFVLDTHAGCGLYDLSDKRATEAEWGIQRLRADPGEAPQPIRELIEATRGGSGRYYPGSAKLVAERLRPSDRLVACELHPEEARALGKRVQGRNCLVQNRDGWQAIRALLPPAERRALVLIDPPYERADEFRLVERGLADGLRRMATGIFALWYPVKSRGPIDGLHRRIVALTERPILRIEMDVWPESPGNRLNGSGVLVINPPWQLDTHLAEALPWVQERLRRDPQAGSRIDWLQPAT
ncbi:MAG: 23S rRNA (adenine(2030)-N(6))-methyltransferase RlmJ [Halothiobacillaceae bacterium]